MVGVVVVDVVVVVIVVVVEVVGVVVVNAFVDVVVVAVVVRVCVVVVAFSERNGGQDMGVCMDGLAGARRQELEPIWAHKADTPTPLTAVGAEVT